MLDGSTPNGMAVINAVNEQVPRNCKIVKTSEDGKIDGINFTVTEESISKYEPQSSQTVTVVSGQTASVNFSKKVLPDCK